jgi:hypothetical protein
MARIGSVAAAPFVGDEFASLYLGATRVPTVPGRPTNIAGSEDGGATEVEFTYPTNGGSSITGYKFYFNGVQRTPVTSSEDISGQFASAFFAGDFTGESVRVSAVNAVGEGLRSEPATVV